MSNPLAQLEDAAKSAVQNVIDWSYGPNRYRSNQAGKTDPIFNQKPMDVLRRAAYYNVFSTLFQMIDDYPFVVADDTLETVIKKLEYWMFPTGTKLSIEDEKLNDLLQKIIKETKFQKKTESIIREAAMMGYCGLRTVYDDTLQKWIYEVKPKEYLIIESYPGIPDELLAIGLEWPIERAGDHGKVRRFWKKERWTKDEYQVWPEKPEGPNGKPKFLLEEATSEPNNYGELPISIITHVHDSYDQGKGVVNEKEILAVKALLRIHHKRHFGHLKYMDPNPIRKNHVKPGEPLDMGIGKVIDITQADPQSPADLTLLEYTGMPESVQDEIYNHVRTLYASAGLKAPPPEDAMPKPGVEKSGIAIRMIDKDDAKTIETLRDNGYSDVLRHFEKIIRMGANLGLPDYKGINLTDETRVEAKFPDFFPPTDDEISLKIANMKEAKLPPDIMARQIAQLFGIEDEKVIKQIEDRIIEQEAMEKPTELTI